ncbi:MAG: hypothetical protein KJ619_01610 [Candidatus Omnitrophica bacterium]|nr:hypothetical protein [Candidatus Omnitrophota bacterium]MBU2250989.1 hypothetical protein [Candidatus Omnitrophota bacterium]MBU2473833.1 hypothetical protein [Candidatus Omnitrophota bacterium]
MMKNLLAILCFAGLISGIALIANSSPPAEVSKNAATSTDEKETSKKLSIELGKQELVLTALKVPFPKEK